MTGISPEQCIAHILHLGDLHWDDLEYHRYGYRRCMRFASISVLYDGFSGNMGICLELLGQGCKDLLLLTQNDSIFYDILHNKLAKRTNLTRIDIAVDDYNGLLNMELIGNKVNSGEIRTMLRRKSEIKGLGDTDGHTVSIGSPKSGTYIRIYDKQAESHTDYPWVRVEMVLRHETAQQFQSKVLEQIDATHPNRNSAIALLGVSILKDKLSFIERTSSNISRCDVSPWWDEFLSDVQPLHLEGVRRTTPRIEKSLEWTKRQAAPTLTLLLCMVGPSLLETLLQEGAPRIDAQRAALWTQELQSAGMKPCVEPKSDDLYGEIIASIRQHFNE